MNIIRNLWQQMTDKPITVRIKLSLKAAFCTEETALDSAMQSVEEIRKIHPNAKIYVEVNM